MAAKPRPIALPITSPETRAQEKPICTAKPMARPAMTSPATSRKPVMVARPSGGRWKEVKARPGMPTASATIARIWSGTKAAPKIGAARKAAPGRIIATSQSHS